MDHFPSFSPYARNFQDKFGNCEEEEGLVSKCRCTGVCVPPDVEVYVCAAAPGHAYGNLCDAANSTSTAHVSLTTEQLPSSALMGKAIIFQESTSILLPFQFTLWESLSIVGGREECKVIRWNGTKENYHNKQPDGEVSD